MSIKHTIRDGKGGLMEKELTPRLAIKYQCWECMGHNWLEVKHCTSKTCSLFPFRHGEAHTGRKGNTIGLEKFRQENPDAFASIA